MSNYIPRGYNYAPEIAAADVAGYSRSTTFHRAALYGAATDENGLTRGSKDGYTLATNFHMANILSGFDELGNSRGYHIGHVQGRLDVARFVARSSFTGGITFTKNTWVKLGFNESALVAGCTFDAYESRVIMTDARVMTLGAAVRIDRDPGADSGTDKEIRLRIRKNGVDVGSQSETQFRSIDSTYATAGVAMEGLSVSAGQYVEIWGYANFDGDASVSPSGHNKFWGFEETGTSLDLGL